MSDKVNKVANTGPDLQERVEIVPAPKAAEKQSPGKPGNSRYSSDLLRRVPGRVAPEPFRPPWRLFAGFFFGVQISAATIAAGPMAR